MLAFGEVGDEIEVDHEFSNNLENEIRRRISLVYGRFLCKKKKENFSLPFSFTMGSREKIREFFL